MEHTDIFELGGKKLTSRLFTGTGKYGDDELMPYRTNRRVMVIA